MLGLGESVTFPSWQLILARHTVEHERGRANGFVSAGQGIGPMLGTLFGGLAMAPFRLARHVLGLGIITLLWLWPWYRVTRARDSMPAEAGPAAVWYAAILRRREFWGAASGTSAVNYMFYFVITWLPSFLVKAGGFTVSQMAGIGAAIYGIYAVTTALAGAASDRWIRRRRLTHDRPQDVRVASCLGAAVTIACSAYVEPRTTCGCWAWRGCSSGSRRR